MFSALATALRRPWTTLLVAVAGAQILACTSHLPRALRDEAAPTPASDDQASTCRAPQVTPAFRLTDAFPGIVLDRPTRLVRDGDVYFVAEQGGTIRRIAREGSRWTSTMFADLSTRLASDQGEGGLIGLALSPEFSVSGELFVFYTGKRAAGKSERVLFESVISRLMSRDGGRSADPLTEERVLSFDRDLAGHNGGQLTFGPDRNLYIGVGDGSWGDPLLRAQNPDALFGKVLRIDVLGARPYRSPIDNPFAGGGGRPEVYAWGLRNPWSFSFDAAGRMWLGDVGHDRWEEINLIVKGGNYGWPLREGAHCFFFHAPCVLPDKIEPVHEYPHVDGFSVSGGFVYRGSRLALSGSYLFGDFITGRIWALDASSPGPSRLLFDSGINVAGFAEDGQGEPLIIDYSGHVLRIEPSEAAPPVETTLAALGCIDAGPDAAMNPKLLPYDINAPFWSDGLDKRRWVSLPPESKIHVGEEGWELPPGAMLLKEFSSGGRRIETRMLVNDPGIGWQGYTFEWNAAQSDAVLIDDAKVVDVDGSPWTLPSRAQCFACHRKSVGRVLGFEAAQLNRSAPDALGGERNQLEALAPLLDAPVDTSTTPSLSNPYDDAAPTDARARAWLHSNCSFCHRASGLGQAMMDLRATVPLGQMNAVCRESGDLDGALRTLVVPGAPSQSALVARIGSPDDLRMPPLGSARIDATGVRVVSAWITSLQGCP